MAPRARTLGTVAIACAQAAATLILVAVCAAVLGALRYGRPVAIAATPLVILVWPGLAGHTSAPAAIVVPAATVLAASSWLSSPSPVPR